MFGKDFFSLLSLSISLSLFPPLSPFEPVSTDTEKDRVKQKRIGSGLPMVGGAPVGSPSICALLDDE